MIKRNLDKIWDKIFGLKIGDRVRIVKVWDITLHGDELVGKLGTIVQIHRSYHNGERKVLWVSRNDNHQLEIQTFSVKFNDGTIWEFPEEDLEKL